MATKRRAKTKYQALVSSKHSFCKGKTTKTAVRKKATAYVKDAVKKGAAKTTAQKVANKVLNSSCKTKAVSGKKRRTKRARRRK